MKQSTLESKAVIVNTEADAKSKPSLLGGMRKRLGGLWEKVTDGARRGVESVAGMPRKLAKTAPVATLLAGAAVPAVAAASPSADEILKAEKCDDLAAREGRTEAEKLAKEIEEVRSLLPTDHATADKGLIFYNDAVARIGIRTGEIIDTIENEDSGGEGPSGTTKTLVDLHGKRPLNGALYLEKDHFLAREKGLDTTTDPRTGLLVSSCEFERRADALAIIVGEYLNENADKIPPAELGNMLDAFRSTLDGDYPGHENSGDRAIDRWDRLMKMWHEAYLMVNEDEKIPSSSEGEKDKNATTVIVLDPKSDNSNEDRKKRLSLGASVFNHWYPGHQEYDGAVGIQGVQAELTLYPERTPNVGPRFEGGIARRYGRLNPQVANGTEAGNTGVRPYVHVGVRFRSRFGGVFNVYFDPMIGYALDNISAKAEAGVLLGKPEIFELDLGLEGGWANTGGEIQRADNVDTRIRGGFWGLRAGGQLPSILDIRQTVQKNKERKQKEEREKEQARVRTQARDGVSVGEM